jgi:hypothetical protein
MSNKNTERERQRERKRQRQTETDRDRQTDRHRDRETALILGKYIKHIKVNFQKNEPFPRQQVISFW